MRRWAPHSSTAVRLAASSHQHQQGSTRQRRHRRRSSLCHRRACRRLAGLRAAGRVRDHRLSVAVGSDYTPLYADSGQQSRRPLAPAAAPDPAGPSEDAATLMGYVTEEMWALPRERQIAARRSSTPAGRAVRRLGRGAAGHGAHAPLLRVPFAAFPTLVGHLPCPRTHGVQHVPPRRTRHVWVSSFSS